MSTLTPQQVYATATMLLPEVRKLTTAKVDDTLARMVTAIAGVESTYNPKAKNRYSTARGLTQVTACTQRDIERRNNLFQMPMSVDLPSLCSAQFPDTATASVTPDYDLAYETEYNTFLALLYLARLRYKYNDDWKATVAYNQGHYNTSAEGQRYAQKVHEQYIRNEAVLQSPRQRYREFP